MRCQRHGKKKNSIGLTNARNNLLDNKNHNTTKKPARDCSAYKAMFHSSASFIQRQERVVPQKKDDNVITHRRIP